MVLYYFIFTSVKITLQAKRNVKFTFGMVYSTKRGGFLSAILMHHLLGYHHGQRTLLQKIPALDGQ